MYRLSDVEDLPAGIVPIGRPIANTQLYVLDRQLQPVPIGVPGELYIGGVGLARGYFNRPDLTAEKFIPNPFGNKPGSRLYKTGDLVRYLSDGNLEFLGRIDNQVKVRGFRVEPGEIEWVLREHTAIQDAVVTTQDDASGNKRLIAYVVLKDKTSAIASKLRDFLKQRLPDYMLPAAFVTLNELPLTPSSKVDRQALPKPDSTRQEPAGTFVPPRDDLEDQLSSIWTEILGIQPIGIKDNFFNLGGHSLLGLRLFAKIEQTFNKKLPLTALFQAPTVEQQASLLRALQHNKPITTSPLVAMSSTGSRPPFFCVPGNLGNVFIDLGDLARYLGPDQPFYGLQDSIQNPVNIKDLATHYLQEIQSIQSKGPYLLGGVCSGAIVAFQMAQQLRAQGQQVALLALIEPSHPQPPNLSAYIKLVFSTMRQIFWRFGHHSHNFSQLGFWEKRLYAQLKLKLVANSLALLRYRPQVYAGSIDLFLTQESLAYTDDPQLDWRKFATDQVKTHEIPGNHNTITGAGSTKIEEVHMEALSKRLRACIDEVLLGHLDNL